MVDGWVAELKRQLNEWFQRQSGPGCRRHPPFELVASGGGFDQPGLLEYLEAQAALPSSPGPRRTPPSGHLPAKGFEVAFGAAAAGAWVQFPARFPAPRGLPPGLAKALNRQRIDLASVVLLVVCFVVLGLGTWHKVSLIHAKRTLLDKVRAGQRAAEANDAFTSDLVSEYENLRPVLAAQQTTIDTLKTLALLQQSRSNRSFWYVLLADQQSYFSQPPALLSTNRPAKTNLLGAALDAPRLAPLLTGLSPSSLTNASPARPGFIAELCVPGDAEAARQVLSELVNDLKQQRLFSKVDLLSDDLRRSLADPKVTITDRDFVLSLDFAETRFPATRPLETATRFRRAPAGSETRRASELANRGRDRFARPKRTVIPSANTDAAARSRWLGWLLGYFLLFYLPLTRQAASLDEPLQKAWRKLAASVDQTNATVDFLRFTNQLSETRQALAILEDTRKDAAQRLDLSPDLKSG